MISILESATNLPGQSETHRETLGSLRGLLHTVASISANFIRLSHDDLDRGLAAALMTIGEYLGIDRAYVMLNEEHDSRLSYASEWCARGAESLADREVKTDPMEIAWLIERMNGGRPVSISDISVIPPYAEGDRAFFTRHGEAYHLVLPLTFGGVLYGLFGLDAIRRPMDWNEESISLLRILADSFANVIEHQRSERAKRVIQESLVQSQKMEAIGQLAGGVAHDFNNILTAIFVNLEFAKGETVEDTELNEFLDEIYSAAERAEGVTRQLLAFSRKQVVLPKVLNLNENIEASTKMLKRLIGEDIDFRATLGCDIGTVTMDPGQVDQILMNLVINARDAVQPGGKVTVETSNVVLDENYRLNHPYAVPGQYVMLAVSDNGCGISPVNQRHVFEPFFTTKAVGKGTGLGLATVYGIVKQNKGSIELYSEPGHGTTFKIYLPTSHGTPTLARGAFPVERKLGGEETILLVEDEDMLRNINTRFLERYGYRVLQARNGLEALELFRRHGERIDLLLTDMVMPIMNGRELADEVREEDPEIRVLFSSGYTMDAIDHNGILAHGSQFLGKPYTPDALVRKVRDVLDDIDEATTASGTRMI